MPGLLQSPEGNFGSAKVIYALIAEFIGTMLFTFAGTATPTGNVSTQTSDSTAATSNAGGSANWAPWWGRACLCTAFGTMIYLAILVLNKMTFALQGKRNVSGSDGYKIKGHTY